MEPFYPLKVWVCDRCFLVQLQEYVSPAEIFTEYAYFSSFSTSWLQHAKDYTDMAARRFGLGSSSRVVEIARNDGYLLQYFVEKGIPVLGIEPAANVAKAAIEKGVPTVVRFFGRQSAADLAGSHGKADLIVGNNVLAHVPDINDFVGGLEDPAEAGRRRDDGVSAPVAPDRGEPVRHDLPRALFVSLLLDRSGDLRGARPHALRRGPPPDSRRLAADLRLPRRRRRGRSSPGSASSSRRKQAAGFRSIERYLSFSPQVEETKRALLAFLIEARSGGKSIVAYGAPGQGQHAAELLRDPHRLRRLRRGSQSVQARSLHARNAHPDLSRRTDPGDAARTTS